MAPENSPGRHFHDFFTIDGTDFFVRCISSVALGNQRLQHPRFCESRMQKRVSSHARSLFHPCGENRIKKTQRCRSGAKCTIKRLPSEEKIQGVAELLKNLVALRTQSKFARTRFLVSPRRLRCCVAWSAIVLCNHA